MVTPTSKQIIDHATHLYMQEQARYPGLGETPPEHTELKEAGFIDRAKQELMTTTPTAKDVYDDVYNEFLSAKQLEEQLKMQDETIEKLRKENKLLKSREPQTKTVYVQAQPDIKLEEEVGWSYQKETPPQSSYDPSLAPYTDAELFEIQEYLNNRKPKQQKETHRKASATYALKKTAKFLWKVIY
jgi:hypothetical protein